MDSSSKNARVNPPVKDQPAPKSKIQANRRVPENLNPNVKTPGSKVSKSATIKPASASSRKKMNERKFLVAKKNSRKERIEAPDLSCSCKERNGEKNNHKCRFIAYDNLRSSQEEFFHNMLEKNELGNSGRITEKKADESDVFLESNQSVIQPGEDDYVALEDVRDSLPEPGSGRVKHLVRAFECLLSTPSSEQKSRKKPVPLFELQHKSQESMSSFCPSDLFMASNVDLDSRLSSSWDSSKASFSISKRLSRGRRSRRNGSESSDTMRGARLKRQLKFTNQRPFKLKTEQRGRLKELDFIRKVQEMVEEEEKKRIPIAQGLPWTTDEAECLVKPSVKVSTIPMDLNLYSDTRAVERAEFDQQIADKLTLIEQYKMERERQQKMEEEEEIKRLRKELIHKAQPMPHFDKPFMIARSSKDPTTPKEPDFKLMRRKKMKCGMPNDSDDPGLNE